MGNLLNSPTDQAARFTKMEAQLVAGWMAVFDGFVLAVIDDAADAMESPVLLAAGRRRDPFAFTNVMARWRAAIRAMAESSWMTDDEGTVKALLEESSIPGELYSEVADVLRSARTRGLTPTGAKRELSALLVPRQGENETRKHYRARIRGIARSVTTQHFNRDMLEKLAKSEFPNKTWISMHDNRVRSSHALASGQTVPLDAKFLVGGHRMDAPGDPTAPLEETASCRCFVVGASEEALTASGGEIMPTILTKPATEKPAPDVDKAATGEDCGCDSLTADGAPSEDIEDVTTVVRWSGPIAMEGVLTGDGRFIEPGALTWDSLPIPFRYVSADVGAHDGAVTTGQIDTIERRDGGVIWGEGTINIDFPEGLESAKKLDRGDQDGVSIDMDSMSFEVRVAQEVIDEFDAMMTEETPVEKETDDEGRVVVMKINADDEVMAVTSARLRAATHVTIPAFAEARITLNEPLFDADEVGDDMEEPELALVASGKKWRPAKSLFDNPNLTEPTPLTVTEDGRVFGHLATWDSCHLGNPEFGACTVAPHTATDYAYFHVGALATDDGDIAVGKLIVDTTHAGDRLKARAAFEHYDHTGTTAAYVRAGEDRYGIWVAGTLNPDASEGQIRSLKASPLSGDWRRINGNMELVAALAVNMPGFAIPRPAALVASGKVQSMRAVGMLPPKRVPRPGSPNELSAADLRYLKSLAKRAKRDVIERVRVDALRAKVNAAAANMKVAG